MDRHMLNLDETMTDDPDSCPRFLMIFELLFFIFFYWMHSDTLVFLGAHWERKGGLMVMKGAIQVLGIETTPTGVFELRFCLVLPTEMDANMFGSLE